MRVIRGFPDHNVVACYTEPNEIGDIEDFDAPRNAPAKDPLSHLDKIAFHSEFFQYELAVAPQTVTVTHAAIPSTSTRLAADPFAGGGSPVGVTVYGQQVTGSNDLLIHDLGYVPLVLVAWDGRILVGGTIVQFAGVSSRRFASVFASTSVVGINWCGYSDTSSLPAIDVTYQVLVFRTPAADPALPLFSGGSSGFQMGRGKINSASQYLRRAAVVETPYDFDLDRTVDLNNGGARVVTGGNVQNDPVYGGVFAGGGYVPVIT